MDRFPTKLNNSPLVESICELRFNTILPSETIIGIVFQSVSPLLDNPKIVNLPLFQMPIMARNNIPDIDYQALQQIISGDFVIGVGTKVVTFSQRKPYTGWDIYSKLILNVITKLIECKLFKEITRVGLRYVNILDCSLYEATNFKLSYSGKVITNATTSMTRLEERLDDSLVLVFNLNNNVLVGVNHQKPRKASMIDIDVIQNINITFNDDEGSLILNSSINKLHDILNERFFYILDDNYLNSLGPIYVKE